MLHRGKKRWLVSYESQSLRRINEYHTSRHSMNIRPDSFICCSILTLDAAGYLVYLEL